MTDPPAIGRIVARLPPEGPAVLLHLTDPAYTDRLTAYLTSLGQRPVVAGPAVVELNTDREEIEVYLRVWKVLYPDADVRFGA